MACFSYFFMRVERVTIFCKIAIQNNIHSIVILISVSHKFVASNDIYIYQSLFQKSFPMEWQSINTKCLDLHVPLRKGELDWNEKDMNTLLLHFQSAPLFLSWCQRYSLPLLLFVAWCGMVWCGVVYRYGQWSVQSFLFRLLAFGFRLFRLASLTCGFETSRKMFCLLCCRCCYRRPITLTGVRTRT